MKKNSTLIALFVLLVVGFMACSDSKESSSNTTNTDDKVQTADISKLGAVETVLTTEHLNDAFDLLVTTHKVWKNNTLVGEKRHVDTVPSLGTATQSAADSQGNATTATGKKDYEFYITVK